jgi:hypothetical protein
MPEVRCTVNNCAYWDEQNICRAERVLITSGVAVGKAKDGEDARWMEKTPAMLAQGTYCWTMVARAAPLDAPPFPILADEYDEEWEEAGKALGVGR